MRSYTNGMTFDAVDIRFLAQQAKRYPVLKPEEERELLRRAAQNDPVAFERLIGSHLRFVIKLARRYRGWGLPMQDLVQQGILGLIHAVKKFNPDENVRLSTYAGIWIRSAMQDYLIRSWSVVRLGTTNAQKALFLQVRKVAGDFAEGAGSFNDELVSRLAKSFGATAHDVMTMARRVAQRDQSLEMPVGEEGAGEVLSERIPSAEPTPEDVVIEEDERRYLRRLVASALNRLPSRERTIIRRRYFGNRKETFSAIAASLNLSKSRVRQLEIEALYRISDILRPALAGHH